MDKFWIVIIILLWFSVGYMGLISSHLPSRLPKEGFTCTQQRAVSDTMPQEFECVQWTKENEDGN